MEGEILLWIHGWARPVLDALFLLSHELGNLPLSALIVAVAGLWHFGHGRRAEALLWLVLGLTTLGLQEAVKAVVVRPRPHLWPWLISQSGYSFPSGHAIAGATFYPLLAWDVSSRWPRARVLAWTLAVTLAFFVGFGRLYLGVHWPTDVLAGWALGAGQTALGLALLKRRSPASTPA